jgi:hypothetical protein
MSNGIAACAAKHGRTMLLVAIAISIGIVGVYVAYPYSSSERAVMAKISRTAAAAGLASGWFGGGMSADSAR